MKEYVRHACGPILSADMPFDDRVVVELEERPTQLLIANKNNFGLDISDMLQGLGFSVAEGKTEGSLILMNTPEKILGKSWALSRPELKGDEQGDPNIFTIYLNHESGVGYVDFLRQIRSQQGTYRIFFP